MINLFLEDGTLYSFGSDYCGCLGLGFSENMSDDEESIFEDSNNVYLPIPVTFFANNGIKIRKVNFH
jgi:hypothetical protein